MHGSIRHTGNRLAVPRGVKSRHFFYKTTRTACSLARLEALSDWVRPFIKTRATEDHIETVDRETLVRECGQVVGAAWDAVVATLPKFVKDAANGALEILGCEWAAPHADAGPALVGYAIYSVVLHAGPHAYRMQTLHTRPLRDDPELTEVVTSTRRLQVGDAFVFDASTPHLVVPERPHQAQLLLLLQALLPDEDEDDRDYLLSRIRPARGDRNYQPT